MKKRGTKFSNTSAPLGVLLDNEATKSLKKMLGHRSPLSFQYTIEELNLLLEMLDEIEGELLKDRTFTTILINLNKAIRENTPMEAYLFMHGKRYGRASKLAYDIMYDTVLEQVPLHVNKEYIDLIAKWRLKINK
jgi:hypothetical protein